MKYYFVVGTDTNCGKTYVTMALSRALKQQQKRVIALKPVASGGECIGEDFINEDVQQLQAVNALATPSDALNISPWRFIKPVSPHLAAAAENKALQVNEIAHFCQTIPNVFDYVLVEGAGGLMVPLNHTQTWLDFLFLTRMPVLLVVGMRLGCLNHALLTAEVMQSHGISCAGWVANCLDPAMLLVEENIQTLKDKLWMPWLATLSYGGQFENFKKKL